MTSSVAPLTSPASEADIIDIVRDGIAHKKTFALSAGGTHQPMGREVAAAERISLNALSGITLYEPREMVISARAGTPVSVIEQELAQHNQMLPFEVADYRALLGTQGHSSIGGFVATHISGPRRIRLGALRDHLIGVRLVNGFGEAIKSGGRVMKNVTGLDLVKIMCGAYGTLGVLTEVTFKVLPIPKASVTLGLRGLDDDKAIKALSAALGSPFEVSGAAHLPITAQGHALTCMRLENWPDALAHRSKGLTQLLSAFGTPFLIEGAESLALWRSIADVTPLVTPATSVVWRITTAPSRAAHVISTLKSQISPHYFYDWGGGLLWLALPDSPDCGAAVIRQTLAGQGQASLIRAPHDKRAHVDVFEPLSAPLRDLTRGIKASFDPHGLFNPQRMYADI
jgi:glycolate oxidase FAD binding subunit